MNTSETPPLASKDASNAANDHASLFESARRQMAARDQEAMRRARWTMVESSDYDQSSQGHGTHLMATHASTGGMRRSSLSRQVDGNNNNNNNTSRPTSSSATGATATTATPPAPSAPAVVPPQAPVAGTRFATDDQKRQSGGTTPSTEVSQYVIAVVGHEGVGKTAVVRRAVKSWSGSPAPVTTYTPDGHAISSSHALIKATPGGKLAHDCNVEFVEVNLKALDLSGVAPVWPASMSPVSGAILCYDAERRDTLRGLSEALHLLCPALPMVLFACKSDPDKKLEVDAQVGDSIGQPYNVGLIEVTTSPTAQGKHKMRAGLRWLLYRLEERQRRDARRALSLGCSAAAASSQPSTSSSPRLITNDAESDSFPWSRGHATTRDGLSDTHSSASSLGWMMQQQAHQQQQQQHQSGGNPGAAVDDLAGSTTLEDGEKSAGPPAPSPPVAAVIPTTTAPAPTDPNDAQSWTMQSELMTRLFTAIVSTENDSFVNAFFMTYRRFCHPSELMTEFLDRFVEVEGYPVSRDIRMWALMKLAGALLDWLTRYPGDLAAPETRVLFNKTISCMLKYTFLAHLTQDLARIEQSAESSMDIDMSWSCHPKQVEKDDITPALEVVVDREELCDDDSSTSHTPMSKGKAGSTRSDMDGPYQKRALASDQHTATTATTDSSSDISRSVYSGEDAGHQRWSAAFHAVLQMDPHTFALELTRMQWEMFSSIRPRDILRHDLGKERDEPVSRSIEFFNHLSRFVSTMVLASPKPKNRARVYEAFVKIAHQLRRLNNYDSLSAVISGLRETSVHRLSETHKLVRLEPMLGRDFQSHIRLVDPRASYVHYRRALQADSTYGHTAIPLLSAVLSLVSRLHAGRPEDRRAVDGAVQWGKFQRFGEILEVIPDFQARGPMVPGAPSASFRRLIEATPVIQNEDGLYERSKLIEAGGSQGTNMLRKLAANLAL